MNMLLEHVPVNPYQLDEKLRAVRELLKNPEWTTVLNFWLSKLLMCNLTPLTSDEIHQVIINTKQVVEKSATNRQALADQDISDFAKILVLYFEKTSAVGQVIH